jgi:hypothetical protein
MLCASLQQRSPPRQFLLQKGPTGGAQRSGAKSGAKRLDLRSNRDAQHDIKPIHQPSF